MKPYDIAILVKCLCVYQEKVRKFPKPPRTKSYETDRAGSAWSTGQAISFTNVGVRSRSPKSTQASPPGSSARGCH